MKFSLASTVTLALCASQAVAFPTSQSVRASPELEAELSKRHAEIQLLRERDPIIILGLGVYAFIEAAGAALGLTAGDLSGILGNVFGGVTTPWDGKSGNCVIHTTTHGGAECYAETTAAAASGNSTSDANKHSGPDWNVCPWTDFSQPPPAQFFTDPGIGKYSVQFTATDTQTWSGADKTSTCVAEGLCNPRFTFYRDGFSIVVDSWVSQGDPSMGTYTDGDFGGICYNYVQDQFSKGGDVLAADCGIPCWNQGAPPGDHVDQ